MNKLLANEMVDDWFRWGVVGRMPSFLLEVDVGYEFVLVSSPCRLGALVFCSLGCGLGMV